MTRLAPVPLLCLAACATSHPTSRETTQAVLWVQSSAEYAVAVQQVYRLAGERLEAALAAGPASPAVILDLDETVLDNSAFEARLIARDADFDLEQWHAWLAGTEARALPGAVEFVRQALARGVEVYLVTNRSVRYRDPTVATLRKLGLEPGGEKGPHLLMKDEQPGWGNDKASRREHVAARHAVLLLLGDDLNDFVSCARLTPAQRRELAQRHADRFGRDWLLVPSPNWGTWLDAVYGYGYDEKPAWRRARQLEALRLD